MFNVVALKCVSLEIYNILPFSKHVQWSISFDVQITSGKAHSPVETGNVCLIKFVRFQLGVTSYKLYIVVNTVQQHLDSPFY